MVGSLSGVLSTLITASYLSKKTWNGNFYLPLIQVPSHYAGRVELYVFSLQLEGSNQVGGPCSEAQLSTPSHQLKTQAKPAILGQTKGLSSPVPSRDWWRLDHTGRSFPQLAVGHLRTSRARRSLRCLRVIAIETSCTWLSLLEPEMLGRRILGHLLGICLQFCLKTLSLLLSDCQGCWRAWW